MCYHATTIFSLNNSSSTNVQHSSEASSNRLIVKKRNLTSNDFQQSECHTPDISCSSRSHLGFIKLRGSILRFKKNVGLPTSAIPNVMYSNPQLYNTGKKSFAKRHFLLALLVICLHASKLLRGSLASI